MGTALNDADLVVEPLDEAQRDFVIFMAIGLDPIPVGLDHPGELPERFQPLPLQGVFPVGEETTGPAGAAVVPDLVERLLQQVGRMQSLVGPEQQLQRLFAFGGKVLLAGEEVVSLPLDEPAILPREAGGPPPPPPPPPPAPGGARVGDL